MRKAKVKSKKAKKEVSRGNKILVKLLCFSLSPLLLFFLSLPTAAQITIEKSVVSSGGGTTAGGAFTLENTFGQPSAGLSQSPPFILFGGFITPNLAPTAANVSISGRITTANGAGIRNVSVVLNYPNGTTRTVSTGTFGAYRFEDVPVGEIYIVTVSGKKFTFENPVQVISLTEQISDLNFVAAEQ